MSIFAGGIVIGLALGWGLYWYMTQRSPAFRRLETVESPALAVPEVLFTGRRRDHVQTLPAAPPHAEPVEGLKTFVTPIEEEEPPIDLVAYCVRCRTKRAVRDPEPAGSQNGQAGYRGTCEVCGARVFALQ